ncbi:MAG TPA: alpha-hydroxy acid oxidase [Gemmatimonadales bacterium]|nr:alpha-hydroxy acid oxidase [Gemmatimonadales bacterium]
MDSLDQLLNLWDFERAAEAVLEPMAWRYYSGAAGDERTLRENRLAFERRRLRPRVLVDVGCRSLATTVLGRPTSWPVLVAPMAFHGLACGEAEAATARAAAAQGTVFCVSTMANLPLERVRAAAPEARQWFQLYVQRDRGVTAELVRRAAAAGYEALVVTVDAPALGRREADLRHGFSLPAHLTPGNLELGDAALLAGTADARSALAAQFSASTDPSMTWRDFGWLRSLSPLPIVLKGVLHPDDARRAADEGVDAVVVSNHGGRQLDGAIASLDALPAVAAAAGGGLEVLLDGGIRRGTDVLTALALGARAVLLGRPVLWGLAVAGEAGAARVLSLLRDEVDLALALTGCTSPAEVTGDLLG